MLVPEARNAISAPGPAEHIIFQGSVQYSMYCLPSDFTVQRKEKRQSESDEKPEALRGCYWCSHGPRARPVCRASGGRTHRVPGRSSANAPSPPGWEKTLGSATAAPQRAPKCRLGKPSLPAFVPRIYNGFIIYNTFINPCPSPAP